MMAALEWQDRPQLRLLVEEEKLSGLLVHGLKGRKPRRSEGNNEEVLTEDTIR